MTATRVSFVSRSTRGLPHADSRTEVVRRPGAATASPSTARKRSFSAGSPIVTRRQPSSRGQPLQSRTRTPASRRRCQTSRASWRWKRTRMKLAPDGNASTPASPRSARPAATPAPFLHQGADAAFHVGDVSHGECPGELLGGVEVVRQDDLVELIDHPRRRHRVPEPRCGHAPRLGERPHDDQPTIVGHPVERRPRRELGVGLVDDHEARRLGEHGVEHLWRLDHPCRVVRRAQERHRRCGARRSRWRRGRHRA